METDKIENEDIVNKKNDLTPIVILTLGLLSLIPNTVFRIVVLFIVICLFITIYNKLKDFDKKNTWYLKIGAFLTSVSFFSAITGLNTFLTLIVAIIVWVGILKERMRLSGKLGENFVISVLNKLNPNQYVIINDVLLPSNGNIKTTQIDHVVVSNFGVFCVETKDYTGWIYGRANDAEWTQSFNRYDKYKFYNPLRQNYAHVKAVENLIATLNLSAPVFSFVAFPSADKLKISGTNNVGFARDILYKIKSIKKQVLSDSEIDLICDAIYHTNIVNKNEREEHVNSVINIKN